MFLKYLIVLLIIIINISFCHETHSIDKDHVLEHLDGVINKPKDQLTPDEQNFYYFKLHDYDNNNMLDGLELVNAFAHNDGNNNNKYFLFFKLFI